MIGEILAFGDELICGKSLDTNSQWLARQLSDAGVQVRFHNVIGDDLDDSVAALRLAHQRSAVVVCSGGLGPTEDDLTRSALARLAGVELEFDPATWQHIQALFGRRQRPVPVKNQVQAYFPAGSRIIPNPNGTAPGIDLTIPKPDGTSCCFFALPGVPAEMIEMWHSGVLPQLQLLAGGRQLMQRTLRCFGAGESDIEQMIPAEIMARGRNPLVGITASEATISLRVSSMVQMGVRRAADQVLEPTLSALRDVLGDLVYGTDDDTLASVVLAELARRRQTIAIVDFGLHGLVGQWLAELDRESGVFLGSVDSLTHAAAQRMFQCDSSPSASLDLPYFAQRVREYLGSSFGLAIGPWPTELPADGPAWFSIAVSTADRTAAKRLPFGGHPSIRRARCAKQVLNHLRLDWLR